MDNLYLQDIFIYPIKSLGGISVEQAEVQDRGLRHDRRWMLVDEKGTFLSQRSHSNMALLQVDLAEEGLIVTHKKELFPPLLIPFDAATARPVTVSIWDDVCLASEVSEAANKWFSNALDLPVQLVRMPETTRRLVEEDYARNEEVVSFADAYPFLAIGQSSLDDLNRRLEEPVLINRFRPNFVFSGGAPYCEDSMQSFSIGDIVFYGVKLCSRCVLTTVNQEDGTKGKEPLRTLATYRTINNKIMFGQNLLHRGAGIIRKGDKVSPSPSQTHEGELTPNP